MTFSSGANHIKILCYKLNKNIIALKNEKMKIWHIIQMGGQNRKVSRIVSISMKGVCLIKKYFFQTKFYIMGSKNYFINDNY